MWANCGQQLHVNRDTIGQIMKVLSKNKHVTEGHLTLFVNTFPNFSQYIANSLDFFFMEH